MAGKFHFREPKPAGAREMPFLDHLEELRWRIIWSLLALVVASIFGFWLVMKFDVLNILILPARPYIGDRLHYLSLTDPFMITLKLGILVGFLLAFPIITYQVWAFVSPALHRREKRAIVPALYFGLVLFAAGVSLAYFYVVPATARFMTGFQTGSLMPMLVVDRYVSIVTKVLVSFGIIFELPVVVLVLSALGLITSKFLRAKRRFAIAGMTVTASLLTPGDTITVTLFMMIPLILLYELSIGLAVLMERSRARDRAEDEVADELAEVP
ncbi:MAG TPA: twin-arginine translocase subunit TatC [Longimicrobiales bacterium]|nr:twin-arginine translocase subunit TatC [Longimicrobiales bacterium]